MDWSWVTNSKVKFGTEEMELVSLNDVARQQDVQRIFPGGLLGMGSRPECSVHWYQTTVKGGQVFPKYGRHPAFVKWVGHGSYHLCKEALDAWLDNADADPSLEPFELIFLEREHG